MSSTSKYGGVLEECSRVATEEFQVASSAVEETEALIERLRRFVASITDLKGHDGTVVADARQRLCELHSKLDASISDLLPRTRQSLATKRAKLHRFTVTLFGRTMAGKSTIRETLTRGDGSTIGKGAQRTTRDVREYEWNLLRIIDTPGIGAYEGDEDRKHAISVIDESDVILFLVSSDSIQEESFKGMQVIRQHNKPLFFILNVMRDLEKPVFMRRFLNNPNTVFAAEDIRGHLDRIHKLAGDFLGMRDIRVVPIHAQAAYLSTRPEHRIVARQLDEQSRLSNLLSEIEGEVLHRGTVRRVQTIVDGTIVSLLELQEELHEQAKVVRKAGLFLKDKFGELDIWLDGFIRTTNARAETDAALHFQSLRAEISAFVDNNIEYDDVGARWKKKVETLNTNDWLKRQQTTLLDDLKSRLADFSREMSVDSKLAMEFDVAGPKTFNPSDLKRTMQRVSTGGAALVTVAVVAAWIGAENFWNPIGWVSGGVAALAFIFSWFIDDRETTLQRQKQQATEQLRTTVDRMEQQVVSAFRKWFYDNITSRLVRGIRTDTKQLYNGMFDISRALDDTDRKVGDVVERLNRRLLVRTGQILGSTVSDEHLARVVRDPGVRTKFMWANSYEATPFCRDVGQALGEWVDGVQGGSAEKVVASALRPAAVVPSMVSISGQTALVHLPKLEIGRAIGKGGSNINLASRLIEKRIDIIAEENHNA